MDILKCKKGITLIAIIITVIILLILVGVTLTIANDSIICNAEMASAEMDEISTKENVQLVLAEYQIERYSNNYSNCDLMSNLENLEGVSNVNITETSDDSTYIELECNNSKFAFSINETEILESDLLLKGNVKVGDYIEYPIEYIDAYSGVNYASTNGWRIIDDGIMFGTSGSVKIISSHIPLKWYYGPRIYTDSETAINDITKNFEEQIFMYTNTRNTVEGSYFKDNKLAKGVTTLTLEDLNYAYNSVYNTERYNNSIENLNTKDDLLYVEDPASFYWIASKSEEDDSNIYYMSDIGISEEYDMKLGVRPVIILKDDLTGKKENNLWKIN